MRSEIVLGALETQNAFALCHRAFKLVRKSHKPSTRIQETTNVALKSITEVEQAAAAIGNAQTTGEDEARDSDQL